MISTRELRTKPLDTYLAYGEDIVMLYSITEQGDGGFVVVLEWADASGGRFPVEVASQDADEPMWDYDDNDC